MNGCNRYLLDTNAVISLLAGNEGLATELASAQWIGISVINQVGIPGLFPPIGKRSLSIYFIFASSIE